MAAYVDQFIRDDSDLLKEALAGSAFLGQVTGMASDAAMLLQARTLPDLHNIARRMEAVIHEEAASRVRGGAARSKAMPAQEAEVALLRLEVGDAALWLACGAEQAPIAETQQNVFPEAVTRAEYFAVMALWKAVDLQAEITRLMRQLRARPGANAEDEIAEDHPAKRLLKVPMMRAVGGMYNVAYLSSEVTRAATLAAEAKYFEGQLIEAKATGSAEAVAKLQELADHRLREAGALGGRKRAESFEPAKARAQELYRQGNGHRSRDKAAQEIQIILEGENMKVAFTTVRKWLKQVDDEIEAKRQQKPG